MTKEQWEEVKQALTSLFSIVELKVDGYNVILQLQRVSVYKNEISFFIDGKFKGEWFEECEERRRFFKKSRKSILNAKGKQKFKKLSKKVQKEWEEKYFYDEYSPFWSSFSALKKHLEAENESIELVEIKC